jgi:hypothetical protein
MCGDCVEPEVIDMILNPSAFNFEKLSCKNNNYFRVPVCQELTALPEQFESELNHSFKNSRTKKNYQPEKMQNFVEISLCRLFEKNVIHGFDSAAFNELKETFGSDTINHYFSTRKKLDKETIWAGFANFETWNNINNWQNFIDCLFENIATSQREIAEYVDYSENIANSSVDILSSQNYSNLIQKFGEDFLKIFASMIILAKEMPDNLLLSKLALTRPPFCHFFDNCYWLARKALYYKVQSYGFDFIEQNFADIRYLLIAYVLLTHKFETSELKKLKNLVKTRENNTLAQIEADTLLELIDEKIVKPHN